MTNHEFFISQRCIPRNLRIRCRQRFDALQQEASSLKGYIKALEEKQEYALRLIENLQKLRNLELEICELEYFDGGKCVNTEGARKALESITIKGNKICTWIRYVEILNSGDSGIVSAKARLSKIDEELLELCSYIVD